MLAGPMDETVCSIVIRRDYSQPLQKRSAPFPTRRGEATPKGNMTALQLYVSAGRKCEQSGAANPYPRHAPCWFRYAPLARITPRAGAADRGRSRQI